MFIFAKIIKKFDTGLFMREKYIKVLLFAAVVCLFYQCDNAPQMPKPSTYLRLDIKPSDYVQFNRKDYPFVFEYPDCATVEELDSKDKSIKWFNLNFKDYNFTVNMSLLPINTDTSLNTAVNDCYKFLKRHEKLSGGIIQQDYKNNEKKIYGTVFDIKGKDVVSPYQFYLTDSVKYFVRGALNCNVVPNNDSCSAVIKQLKEDLTHLINTFEWKY